MKTIPFILCIMLVACASNSSRSASIPPERVVGTWDQSRLFENVSLTLKRDSGYEAVWTGCLGVYGTASGTWRMDGNELVLSPTEEKDMRRFHLRKLVMLPDKQGYILVPPEHRSYLNKRERPPLYYSKRTASR